MIAVCPLLWRVSAIFRTFKHPCWGLLLLFYLFKGNKFDWKWEWQMAGRDAETTACASSSSAQDAICSLPSLCWGAAPFPLIKPPPPPTPPTPFVRKGDVATRCCGRCYPQTTLHQWFRSHVPCISHRGVVKTRRILNRLGVNEVSAKCQSLTLHSSLFLFSSSFTHRYLVLSIKKL